MVLSLAMGTTAVAVVEQVATAPAAHAAGWEESYCIPGVWFVAPGNGGWLYDVSYRYGQPWGTYQFYIGGQIWSYPRSYTDAIMNRYAQGVWECGRLAWPVSNPYYKLSGSTWVLWQDFACGGGFIYYNPNWGPPAVQGSSC